MLESQGTISDELPPPFTFTSLLLASDPLAYENYNFDFGVQMNEHEAYDTTRLLEDEDDGMGEHMEEGGFDGEDSDNSIECNDLIGEELAYDDAELLEIRGMNQNLRIAQKNRIGPSTSDHIFEAIMEHERGTPDATDVAGLDFEQASNELQGKTVPSGKWPLFWTTFEGGYHSDQRESDDESPYLSDGNESDVEVEAPGRRKSKRNTDYAQFNEKSDMKNVQFEVGLRFPSQKVLKKAILWYSIQAKKDIKYLKNDQQRIHVRCAGCSWEMTVGPDLQSLGGWQIKALHEEHKCARTFKNRLITENWLAEDYLDRILRNPKMLSNDIKNDMKTRYDVLVNIRMCQRAKNNALNAVKNLMKNQYDVLKPYLRELYSSNPGTTCVLKTLQSPTGQPAMFQRFYVSFDSLKRSFTQTCRPIIGVDGCFLKHACGGQLLCAVGRDGNNHMFPVCWVVVEVENRSSWEWFLRLVSEDLKMESGSGWSVISDQQKGLVGAIHVVWPEVEHRQCARHIYSNWSKVHKGREMQHQFWKCAKATSMGQFYVEVDNLKKLSMKAYDDFMARDPATFCKSHFKTHSSCDVVDNNMAETFNSFILLARYKPIVSMLEDIRLALMERMKKKQHEARRFVVGVAPRISEKLEEAYDAQNKCECRWNGGDNEAGFEVLHNGIGHAVDLEKRSCSCRSWDLTGIPCAHAMSAILYMRKQPEDYLAKWYKLDTYNDTYSTLLQPVRGSTFWDIDEVGMVLPPEIERRQPGRRKIARRRESNEPTKKTKYCRKGLPTKCSNCGQPGHDKKKCLKPIVVSTPRPQANDGNKSKKGRPKGGKNRVGRDDREDLPVENPTRLDSTHLPTHTNNVESHQQTNWLSSGTTNSKVRGRGKGLVGRRNGGNNLSKGRGSGRCPSVASGIGIHYSEEGMVYKSSMSRAGVVIRETQP